MSDTSSLVVAAPAAPVEITRAEKPSRGFTKQMTAGNLAAAWLAIAASIWVGQEMATLIVPIMVMLILSLMGVYQGVGHLDLRAMSSLPARVTTEPKEPT